MTQLEKALSRFRGKIKTRLDAVACILFLIPVLDMAGQAEHLDVFALAAGFSFDSPFHGRTFYSDGHIPLISADKMHAACAYMAERPSMSHDLGIQDPKLIFQLIF